MDGTGSHTRRPRCLSSLGRRRTYEYLRRWTTHEDEHVRRLVSEGTRPRLPWAPPTSRWWISPFTRTASPSGASVTFAFTLLLAPGGEPADAIVDYRAHYVGALGTKAPKVFKLTRRRLQPGQPVTVARRHGFDHVSIRRIRPGRHTIDVQVNGRVLGSVEVDVS